MKTRRAELIIEYAFLIGLIATALLAMQTYLKRGVQGVVKATADELGISADLYAAAKNPSVQLNSQLIGIWDNGLRDYRNIDGSRPAEIDYTTQKNITLTETPPSGADPIRTVTYNKDETHVTGEWVTTYDLAQGGSFNALQKIEKPAQAIKPETKP